MKLSARLQKMQKAAELGGRVHRKYFGQEIAVRQKTIASDVQTKADLESERVIVRYLAKQFPGYGIHAEEETKIKASSPYAFIVDPLDGSNNFVLGIPYFSVSIALLYENIVQSALVYHSAIKQSYSAELGKGAYQNGRKISVNRVRSIEKSAVVYTTEYTTNHQRVSRERKKIRDLGISRLLSNWSPSLDYCLLASGRIEGIVQYSISQHDFLAGLLIAKEAGAKVTDHRGKKPKDDLVDALIVSNGQKIHKALVRAV